MPATAAAEPAAGPTRAERRKARTRAKLLAATRDLVARNGVEATTVAAIAEHADVGFGTFYLHFPSKDDAIVAVAGAVVADTGAALDRLTAALDDPAEVVAVSVRHVVGRADGDPIWARFVVRTAFTGTVLAAALARRLVLDLERGSTLGRFDVDRHGLAPHSVGAVVQAALRARLDGAVGPDAPQEAAEQVLRLLGVGASDAHDVARRPLPPSPPLAIGS
jgi:AcrR family transcriptional regulator